MFAVFQRSACYDSLISLSDGLVEELGGAQQNQGQGERSAALVKELYSFLALKRALGFSERSNELKVSPGGLVDKLWHKVLLETEVRDAVHRFLGGDVPHSGLDEARLSDTEKLTRRLNSLNIMALERPSIALEFWQEAGTVMHTIVKVMYGSTVVYVAPGMTSRDAAFITSQFLQAYGGDPLVLGGVIAATDAQQPVAARPTRRRRTNQPHVFVKTMTGRTVTVAIESLDVTVLSVKQLVESQEGIPIDQQRLIFAGRVMVDLRTLGDYSVADRSTLHLVMRLTGC